MFRVQIEASLIEGGVEGLYIWLPHGHNKKKNSKLAKVVEYICLEFKSKPPLSKGGLEGLSIWMPNGHKKKRTANSLFFFSCAQDRTRTYMPLSTRT